jgi:hypothetical protein
MLFLRLVRRRHPQHTCTRTRTHSPAYTPRVLDRHVLGSTRTRTARVAAIVDQLVGVPASQLTSPATLAQPPAK